MLCNVPHRHVSQLLKVFNTSHGNYPLDARTLLRTPRQPTKSITMTPGDYFHFGLKSGLLSYPPKFWLDSSTTDGFVFSKSSKRCGWSIFASVFGSKLDPILVGLYMGRTSKPKSIDDFMKPHLEELKEKGGKTGISQLDRMKSSWWSLRLGWLWPTLRLAALWYPPDTITTRTVATGVTRKLRKGICKQWLDPKEPMRPLRIVNCVLEPTMWML